jgi:hypothetical protein
MKEGQNSDFLYMNLDFLQDKEIFTNYFGMCFESFKKLTGLVHESVVKQNTSVSRKELPYASGAYPEQGNGTVYSYKIMTPFGRL